MCAFAGRDVPCCGGRGCAMLGWEVECERRHALEGVVNALGGRV